MDFVFEERLPETHQKYVISFPNDDAQKMFRPVKKMLNAFSAAVLSIKMS